MSSPVLTNNNFSSDSLIIFFYQYLNTVDKLIILGRNWIAYSFFSWFTSKNKKKHIKLKVNEYVKVHSFFKLFEITIIVINDGYIK